MGRTEAIDYGFMPKTVRDNLDLHSKVPVSKRIEQLIGLGKVGPEGFIYSLRAAREESLHFARTAPNEDLKFRHEDFAQLYSTIIKDPGLQRAVCLSKVHESSRRQKEAVGKGDKMMERLYILAAQRWLDVRDSLPRDKRRLRSSLQLVIDQ